MSLNGRSFADIKPEPVEWLWPGRIPLGGITLLAGDPGLGKSLLTCRLAARVSRRARHAFMATAEDALATVVRPRLAAAGADLRFVHPLERELQLPRDVSRIADAMGHFTISPLLVIDPLTAYLPANINSWQDQSVRGALAPLAHMAEQTGCAVVIVAHLNKKRDGAPIHRIGGSIGIPAAARSGLLLEAEEEVRRLRHFKSNYGQLSSDVTYRIESANADGMLTAKLVDQAEPVAPTAQVFFDGTALVNAYDE